jgi:GxxExxY protein
MDLLCHKIIGAAIDVHRELGPGLLESAYESCLYHDLIHKGIQVERQRVQPILYKDSRIDDGYRIDLFVERKIILELKAVDRLQDIHTAQILTYLKLSGCTLGFLMNFNVTLFKNGLKRVVLGHPD